MKDQRLKKETLEEEQGDEVNAESEPDENGDDDQDGEDQANAEVDK